MVRTVKSIKNQMKRNRKALKDKNLKKENRDFYVRENLNCGYLLTYAEYIETLKKENHYLNEKIKEIEEQLDEEDGVSRWFLKYREVKAKDLKRKLKILEEKNNKEDKEEMVYKL